MHKNRTIKLRSSIFPMFILYISIIIAAIITGVSMIDHKEDQTTEIKEIVTTLSEPEEAEVEQELLNLGEFRLTAYCACEKCCGKWALNRPVDENGETVDGDVIMAICALDLKSRGKLHGNTVVGTVMTNFGFERFCQENDLRFIATKVGDRYVLEEMLLGDYSFGGEQSGHIIFRDFATTGDGQLTATQLLVMLKRSEKKLSELSCVMTKYPQITLGVNVTAEGKIAFYTDKCISEKAERYKEELSGDGRILIRPSGTEPLIRIMVEGKNVEQINRIAKEMAELIQTRLSSK